MTQAQYAEVYTLRQEIKEIKEERDKLIKRILQLSDENERFRSGTYEGGN